MCGHWAVDVFGLLAAGLFLGALLLAPMFMVAMRRSFREPEDATVKLCSVAIAATLVIHLLLGTLLVPNFWQEFLSDLANG